MINLALLLFALVFAALSVFNAGNDRRALSDHQCYAAIVFFVLSAVSWNG